MALQFLLCGFIIARSILVKLPSSFFSKRLVCVNVVHPYCSIDTTAAWKKLLFILSVRSHFHLTDSLSTAVHAFASRMLMSVSVDETLLPRLVNLSTSVVFWPSARAKMPFKMMHRKEVTHSSGSYERKSLGRKLADEMGRAKKIPMVHS